MHGYLLNAHLDGSVPISLKKPTAYNLLDRMEQDGWVEHRDEPTGERPRRVFSVTERGEHAFQDLLREQLKAFTPAEFPTAVSLSFFDAIPAAEARELLQHRRQAARRYQESLVPQDAEGAEHHEHHHGSAQLAIEYARRFIELEIQLLEEVLEYLTSS
jgi:DNA-binding PadR family transcriptional regulator